MTFAKDEVIAALRLRYDHYSAEFVFDLARERAGLPDRHTYEAPELRAWRNGLAAVGDRVGSVLACIDDMLATAVAEPPVPQQPVTQPPMKPLPELGAPRGDLAPSD
jgi:hypothetical protein